MRVPALVYTALSSFVIYSTLAAPTPILGDLGKAVSGLTDTVNKVITGGDKPADEVSASRGPAGAPVWKRESNPVATAPNYGWKRLNPPVWKRDDDEAGDVSAATYPAPTWKRLTPPVWKREAEPQPGIGPPKWRTKPEESP